MGKLCTKNVRVRLDMDALDQLITRFFLKNKQTNENYLTKYTNNPPLRVIYNNQERTLNDCLICTFIYL